MKKTFKGNVLSPLPVALVGTLIEGKPNYCVIGYTSPFNFGKHIFFSLYKKRYTRLGIQENRTFSVNVPSEDLMEQVNICGSRSGRETDKSLLFDAFYGQVRTAPMIEQCPLNMECRVVDILDYDPNEGIIGEVIGSYADSELIENGRIAMEKARLFCWTIGGDFSYYALGERINPE